MRSAIFAVLIGASTLAAAPAHAQTSAGPPGQDGSGAADLCKELLAYAEAQAKERLKSGQSQASAPAAAPMPRRDDRGSGTQGGGSVGASASNDTSSQGRSAPTTMPVSPGAASEPATSPHATDGSNPGKDATPVGASVPDGEFKLAGDVTVAAVRDAVTAGERQTCRDLAQTVRRAGGDMPAPLIALAAYEPDPAKRR